MTTDGKYAYSYDANGNLIEQRSLDDGAVTTYTYDAEDRLIRVVTPKAEVTFQYDPLGRRTEKRGIRWDDEDRDREPDEEEEESPRVIHYLYDQEDILATFDDSGRELARYTHGPGIDEPLAEVRRHITRFYHADVLGTILALTETHGHRVRAYRYTAFGVPEDHKGDFQPYRFTGREWDKETGLYYYRARYYEASQGRFTTVDPLENVSPAPPLLPLRLQTYPPPSTNRKPSVVPPLPSCSGRDPNGYVYVKNDPTNLTDPSGAISECAWAAAKTFALCGAGALIAIEFPVSIGIAGCMTLGPGALPCVSVVLGVFEHVEYVALAACAAASLDTYGHCERREQPCAKGRR